MLCLPLLVGLSLAAPEPLPIATPNPGFEDGLKGWAVPAASQSMFRVDETVAHSGKASLRVEAPSIGDSPFAAVSVRGLTGGATYAWTVWCRSEAGAQGRAAVKIEYYNEAGANTTGRYQDLPLKPGEWRQLRLEVQADPDTTKASLLVRLFGQGPVWFDDAALLLVAAAPPLTVAPVRMAASPTSATPYQLDLRTLQPAEAMAAKLSVRLVGPDGARPLQPKIERTGEHTFKLSGELPALTSADYRLEVAAGEDSAGLSVFVPPADRRPGNLTETGTILMDGKPFFPIGLYHISAEKELRLAAEQGFNSIQGGGHEVEQLKACLDLNQRVGLTVDVPLYTNLKVRDNLPLSLAKLKALAGHPALLDWKIIDEPDIRDDIIDQVPDAYRQLKAADPAHAIELTIATYPHYAYWAKFCDILQIDPYPIPKLPLTMVADYTRRAKAVLEPWQNLTVVLQAGWIPGPANQPSYDQARVMVYLALIEGAKGIGWYSFRDPGWYLPDTPLWPRFKELNAETARLGQVALTATPLPEVKSADPKVYAAGWRRDAAILIMTCNPETTAAKTTIAVPGARGVKVLCGPATAKPAGGGIEVELPALGAALLEATAG